MQGKKFVNYCHFTPILMCLNVLSFGNTKPCQIFFGEKPLGE